MKIPEGYEIIQELANIPPVDGLSYVVVSRVSESSDPHAGAYVMSIGPDEDLSPVAYVDGGSGSVYGIDRIAAADDEDSPVQGLEPLVRVVGDVNGETGQIVIKQTEGHWRRYSRWDRIEKAPPRQPDAVVRTLPQCGCGGYLGAPMMFDSFNEMLAYFFVVFSDAEAVNAKHASIITGDSCPV